MNIRNKEYVRITARISAQDLGIFFIFVSVLCNKNHGGHAEKCCALKELFGNIFSFFLQRMAQ